jgi:ATP synthase F1 gamma subunit
MSQIKEQKQRIEDIAAARYITGTLRDIATIELQALQKRFVLNTTVYEELRDLYQLVWRIASREPGRSQGKKQRKRLYVAYTTNRHFYGSLNHNIMRTFMDATSAKDECLIVGTTGKTIWMNRARKRKQLQFMAFEDDVPTREEVQAFLARTSSYDQVFICYPGFVSVFEQEARMADISFLPDETTPVSVTDPGPQFLLEPNVDEMISFFNTQVRYALFERILLETQLSRVSARVVKMDTADQNAEALLKREQHVLRRSFIMVSGRRMLETLVGYIQWHKNVQPIVR